MKRISPGTVTVAVMAVVCGLIAAYVIKQMNQKPVAKPKPAPQGTPIVVARVNIEKNSRIRLSDLEVVNVPPSQEVPKGILRKPQIAADRFVTIPLRAGQAIHENNLLGIGERMPGLAERIPAGHRALTISVGNTGIQQAELNDQAKVDIAMTVKGDHPDLGELATRTLLRGVQVLDAKGARGSQSVSLTVAVTSKDANKLINAQETGTLSVTLVSPQDKANSLNDDDSITRRDLLGLREIPKPVPSKPYTIEKWEGSRLRTIELGSREVTSSPAVVKSNNSNNAIHSTSFQKDSNKVQPKVSGPQL